MSKWNLNLFFVSNYHQQLHNHFWCSADPNTWYVDLFLTTAGSLNILLYISLPKLIKFIFKPANNAWLSVILWLFWKNVCENKVNTGFLIIKQIQIGEENWKIILLKTLLGRVIVSFKLEEIIWSLHDFLTRNFPNNFCSLKKFLGTRIPGYTTICMSALCYLTL